MIYRENNGLIAFLAQEMKEKGYLMNLCRLSFRFFLCSRGRHSFKTMSHLFSCYFVILLLHNHRAGDGGGDIETILSELNSAYPEKPVISPDPPEKRTKRGAPEQVPAPEHPSKCKCQHQLRAGSYKKRGHQKPRLSFLLEQKDKR